ncbi:MAG: hypothetical protein ACP5II_04110 [Infirmifilum sp.]|jgi:hypothetical protein|uniref:Uncharacterized protein n=1 Tax=Infirmifilum uzonense TaxID=1550241 RepID=A0A0F7FI65_9CREN|nr:hypothetical protein [Infirmifilum uzonense]AKG39024.1 hypothetical protein MA03_06920 [Infirmifilum uzonense]
MDKQESRPRVLPSGNLIYSYLIFSGIAKAFSSSIKLLEDGEEATPERAAATYLLLLQLEFSLRDLGSKLQLYQFFQRDEVTRVVYGYIARVTDLEASVEKLRKIQAGSLNPLLRSMLSRVLEESQRVLAESKRLDRLIEKILEKV